MSTQHSVAHPRTDARRRRAYVLRSVTSAPTLGHRYLSERAGTVFGCVGSPHDALNWPSRLAARTWAETELGKAGLAEWAVIAVELAPEAERVLTWDEATAGCRHRDVAALCRELAGLHAHYCERVEGWLRRAGVCEGVPAAPRLTVTASPGEWLGQYSPSANEVRLSLAQACLHLGSGLRSGPDTDFRLTVAHEACHAYQRSLAGPEAPVTALGHGGDFYALMKWGALEPVTKHVSDCGLVVDALRLAAQREVERLAAEGLLAGLPCRVTSDEIGGDADGSVE
jgi:hypothetical protein